MSYASKNNVSKLDYSITLAASLAYLMIHQQDAVGLTLYSEKIKKFLPPKSSRAYLNEILKYLVKAEASEKTNTAGALSEAAEKIKRRGLVIIISDLFDDINSVLKALKHFSYQKNEVIVFQILDPMEKSFAFGKDAIFKDLETEDELTTQPYQIQKAYREAMSEFTNRIKRECLNSNIDYNLIETSAPYNKALLKYIQKREKLY
jgi:uncharacterized protein (DUF58 family)